MRRRSGTFRVMGTTAHVVVLGGGPGVEQCRRRLGELERRWSRFLPDSELSRLNDAAGSGVQVSPQTAALVDRAVRAWRATSGRFDPTVLHALRAAGYEVGETPVIVTVAKDGAAHGIIRPSDEVLEVDGTKTPTNNEVVAAVGEHDPGDDVTFLVRRQGTERTLTVTTKPDKDDPSVPRVGVTIGTKYDYPIVLDNNVGDQIGGSSAGTMFALAIYDRLTPGALTGGLKVAGTGEMSADGVVGKIGGVQQKISGAWRHGANIFLVPAENCAEAVKGDTHGLKLVKITKLDDAIASVEALADDRDAKVPSCS